jgi:hypothetical protein
MENVRSFEEWMHVGGHEKGSKVYAEVEAMMDADIAADKSGFHPRRTDTGEIEYMQTTLFLVAEKPR